jgi:hypothetical protein
VSAPGGSAAVRAVMKRVPLFTLTKEIMGVMAPALEEGTKKTGVKRRTKKIVVNLQGCGYPIVNKVSPLLTLPNPETGDDGEGGAVAAAGQPVMAPDEPDRYNVRLACIFR